MRVLPLLFAAGGLYGQAVDDASVLIRFGADGATVGAFHGRVRADGAEVVDVAGWQFDAGDVVNEDFAWRAATKRESYWYAPWERSLEGTKRHEKLTERGVVVTVRGAADAKLNVDTAAGEFSFRLSDVPWGVERRYLGGKVSVARAPQVAPAVDGPDAEDYVAAVRTRAGERWLAWQTYREVGDRLWVRKDDAEPVPLTEAGRDLHSVGLAEAADGSVWAVWSEQVDGNWDLYARHFDRERWGAAERLTEDSAGDIYPSVAADAGGNVYVVWQSFRRGDGDIYLRVYDGRAWRAAQAVTQAQGNDWQPHVAARGDGEAAIVWDSYRNGNYDVYLREMRGGTLGGEEVVADSDSFEARPRATYGPRGRLWVNWDEGDADWGKDYVNGIQDAGMGLLMRRQVRVAVRDGGAWKQLAGDLPGALGEEEQQIFHAGQMHFDGAGNPWLLFRYRTNTPNRPKPTYRSMWRIGATVWRQGSWSSAVEFAGGYGRIDAPLAVTRSADGGLELAWTGDGRTFPTGFPAEQDLYAATVGPARAARELALVPFVRSTDRSAGLWAGEAEDVTRLREYRYEVDGKQYRIVRGDMHRHTDISWDGNRDGSLDDSYRYALDAAAMDYHGVADHQAGMEVEYHWWMIQKAADLFRVDSQFEPLYGYERSRSYPSGHKNAMFFTRNVPVTKMLPEESGPSNQTFGLEHFYKDLRKYRGIVMAHTSATGAGTDWTDNDPDVETAMEIYQGYRTSYEHTGGPRSTTRGSRPAGMVWNAWEKGLKLGVQCSSDHVSTHASYGMILVEEHSREEIIEAIRARRMYAATDNILLDFRVDGRVMGEAFVSRSTPELSVRAVGTAGIRKVEVIKNNEYVHTHRGDGAEEVSFQYRDQSFGDGESWYYVRVEQVDGEIAWASPVWVTRKGGGR